MSKKASAKSIRDNYFDNIKNKGDRVIFYQCSKCLECFEDTKSHKCKEVKPKKGKAK